MQAINISYLADVDSGIRQYIRYTSVGRNIEIVLERSRQGLLRLETIAFRQVQDWLIALLELLPISVSLRLRMYWPRNGGLFLKHTLQVPQSNRALRHFFSDRGRSGYPRSRQNTMDSDGVIITSGHHLTSSCLHGKDLLEQLLKHGDFRPPTDFSLTPGVTSDPQPDDTALPKGPPSGVNCTSTPRLSAGLGNRSNPAFLHARRSSMRVIAPGRRKARFSAQRE